MKYQIIYLCLVMSLVWAGDFCATKDESQCLTCVEGAKLRKKSGKCVCDAGYIPKQEENKCEKIVCMFGCEICKNKTTCQNCIEDASLINQKCQCDDGFTPLIEENICEQISCGFRCQTCKNEKECQKCVLGAQLKDSKCECEQGYTIINDQNKCEKCPPGCKQCKSLSECLDCVEGAKLKNSLCECDVGYTINTELNKCEKIKCPTACAACNSQTECTQCIENAEKKQAECKCLEGYSLNSAQNKCDKIICPFGCNKCESESKCTECFEGAQLDQGKCQCKEGYKTTSGLNFCFELICPIGCKTCQTTFECSECFTKNSKFNSEYNNCQCSKDLVNLDFVNECITPNKTIEYNFNYNLNKTQNKPFEFCKLTSFNQTLLDSAISFQFSDSKTEKLKNKANKSDANFLAFLTVLTNKEKRGNLFIKYESSFPIKYKKEMKDVSFNIFSNQGFVKNTTDRYVGFDIRDPESLYHFNLIINCGNVDELSNEQINQLLDNYFGLFYVCPPNCKDCTFEGETVKCQKCIDQFNLTDEGKCKYKYPYNKCEKPYYPSQNNTCVEVVNDELLICSNNDKCYNCLDQKNAIDNMNSDSCTCQKGYYLDSRKLECLKCEDLCEECEFRKSYCQKCKGNAYLDYETNMCKECQITNCQQCESDKICKNCQSGYYLDNQNSACTECKIPNCKNCLNEKQCIDAQSGYYVDKDEIKECSIPNCSICDSSTCKVCKEEFIINTQTNICEQCNDGCRICKLDNQKLCTSCKSGYYQDPILDLQCKKCITNCQECFQAQQCDKCVPGITLKNSVCQCEKDEFYDANKQQCIKCSNNCIECENQEKCSKCETGYFINKKQCQKCLTDCKQCKNEKQCQACLDGKIMSKDKDKCSCMEGCQKCSLIEDDTKGDQNKEKDDKKKDAKQKEICTQQLNGYYLEEQKTLKCDEGCNECVTKDNCLTCIEGYLKKKDENKCQKCSDNCSTCDDQLKCITCIKGYYLKDNECLTCGNCLDCSYLNANIICTNCKASMYLEAGKCIEENCKNPLKDGKCDSCNNGYYLDDGKCKKCNENCQQCDKSNCTKCDDAYYAQGSQCLKCSDFCTKCLLKNKQELCQSCIEGYSLNTSQKCSKQTNIFTIILIPLVLIALFCLHQHKERIKECIFPPNNEKFPSRLPEDPEQEMGTYSKQGKENFKILGED